MGAAVMATVKPADGPAAARESDSKHGHGAGDDDAAAQGRGPGDRRDTAARESWAHARRTVMPLAKISVWMRLRQMRVAVQKRLLTTDTRVVPVPKATQGKVAGMGSSSAADGDGSSAKELHGMSSKSMWAKDAVYQLIGAAHNGDTQTVEQLLKDHAGKLKIDASLEECDDDTPCRQSALTKAVRYGHLDTARYLLDNGADPLHKDARLRTPWYYACFSVSMPEGTHPEMVALLLEYIPHVTPLLLRFACHSSKGVADLVLDTIERRVVTRDAKHNYTVVFTNLHYLDDGSDALVWPDGTPAPKGETALDALVSREASELTHPAVMGLLNWKVSRFAQRLAIFELLLYFAWLVAQSTVCVLVSVGGDIRGGEPMVLDRYDGPGEKDGLGTARLTAEIVTLVLSSYQLLNEVRVAMAHRSQVGLWKAMRQVLLRCTVYCVPVVIAGMRAAGASATRQIEAMAVGVVVSWLMFVSILVLVPHLGQFFIMVSVMLRRDIPLFLVVLAVIVPGFAFAFNMLHSNVRELHVADMSETGAFTPSAATASFSTVMAVGGLGTWTGGAGHASPTYSALWLSFTLVGPVLALNLLIAQLNNTYSMLQSAVMKEWVVRMATYVVRRQALLEPEVVQLDSQRDGVKVAIKAKYNDFFVDEYLPGAVGGTSGDAASAMAREARTAAPPVGANVAYGPAVVRAAAALIGSARAGGSGSAAVATAPGAGVGGVPEGLGSMRLPGVRQSMRHLDSRLDRSSFRLPHGQAFSVRDGGAARSQQRVGSSLKSMDASQAGGSDMAAGLRTIATGAESPSLDELLHDVKEDDADGVFRTAA